MRLTEKQAELYRELVAECATREEALEEMRWFLEDWKERSKPMTRDQEMIIGLVGGFMAMTMLAALAKQPEFVSGQFRGIGEVLRTAVGDA